MLKKQNRLSTKYEFARTKRFGTKYNAAFFYLYCLAPPKYTGPTRLGFVSTANFDKSAVKRNRAKRVLREVFRINFGRIKSGYWAAVYPKPAIKDVKYEDVNTDFNKLLSRLPFAK